MIPAQDISVVIADDHPLILKGLYEELIRNNYNVLGKAEEGEEALQLILNNEPKVALLDIDMPKKSGFEIAEEVKKRNFNTKIVVLSFHKEIEFIAQAKRLKIDGYLLKENPFPEIELCIRTVLEGKNYFSSSFKDSLLACASEESEKISRLTPSEKTILRLIVSKKTNKEIADVLGISSRTVEKHRSNIISKLELPTETKSLMNWVHTNRKLIENL